ncbi:MAG: hypothetical protein B0W54_09300 [Cellvibrio sp. 79]|nr:MAG: hypothetical protein B0W54_09300 [Cellvibrio sp. 79]
MKIEKDGDQIVFSIKMGGGKYYAESCLVNSVSAAFKAIDEEEANQLARWQLIVKDLEFSEVQLKECLDRMKIKKSWILDRRDIDSMILKSLFDSAVISYMKSFNQAKGRRVKLECKEIFSNSKDELMLHHHCEIRDIRDSYIAHAGINRFEFAKPYAVLDPNPPPGIHKLNVVLHTCFSFPDSDFVQRTYELVKFVKIEVVNKLQDRLNQFTRKVIDDPRKYKLHEK